MFINISFEDAYVRIAQDIFNWQYLLTIVGINIIISSVNEKDEVKGTIEELEGCISEKQ